MGDRISFRCAAGAAERAAESRCAAVSGPCAAAGSAIWTIGAAATGAADVRVMTTPVPNQPFTSMEPISGASRRSWASRLTSFRSIERMLGLF